MKTISIGSAILLMIATFLGGVFVGYRLPGRGEPLIASLVNVKKEEAATGTKAITQTLAEEYLPQGESAKVIEVLDGDTIIIEGGEQVRYIGIDAPEHTATEKNVCYADEAMKTNKLFVEGKVVRLIRDTNDRDPLERLLRYVYVETTDGKGVMVNENLVSKGAAFATPYPPDTKFEERFLKAEEEAKAAKRGLWSACEEINE